MILSLEHRFVFIKGLKVGGTSAEMALAELCGPEDIVTPITPVDEAHRLAARNYSADPEAERAWLDQLREGTLAPAPPRSTFFNHMTLAQVAAEVDLTGFRVLFVERSPYAKVLSLINWQRTRDSYRTGRALTSTRPEIAAGFDERRVLRVRNIHRYRWPGGALAGAPWRSLELEQEIASLAGALGRPAPVVPRAKEGIRSDERDPREWFTDAQLDFIEAHFAEEFDAFGYPRIARGRLRPGIERAEGRRCSS